MNLCELLRYPLRHNINPTGSTTLVVNVQADDRIPESDFFDLLRLHR